MPSRSRHHIRPFSRSRDDSPDNLVVLDDRLHRLTHQLFGNALPSEYFAIANANPDRFARRCVVALIRHFSPAILPTLCRLVQENRFTKNHVRRAFSHQPSSLA